jgi:hypothetical protein
LSESLGADGLVDLRMSPKVYFARDFPESARYGTRTTKRNLGA